MSPYTFDEYVWWRLPLTYLSFVGFMLLLSSFEWCFHWTLINFQLEKHEICRQSCIWIWIHKICRGCSAQCNIHILEFLHIRSWYGLSISNLVRIKWKQHTYLQIECKTLSTKDNSATMQIISSHDDNYEKMKEGNYFIHIGIIIWNSLFWSHCFFRVPHFFITLDFAKVWIFF
jgi:hypothetical protein